VAGRAGSAAYASASVSFSSRQVAHAQQHVAALVGKTLPAPVDRIDQGGNPATRTGSGPEFGTVDKSGNVFAGEPRPRVLRKYVKVR
jgi:hypothetical protein